MLKVKNLSKKRKIQLSILVVYSIICLAMLIYAIVGLAWISKEYANEYNWLNDQINAHPGDAYWTTVNKNIQPDTWILVKLANGHQYMYEHAIYLTNHASWVAAGKTGAEPKDWVQNYSSTYSGYMWGNAFGWLMLVPLILWLIVGLLLKYRPRPEPSVKLEKKILKEHKKAEKLAARKAKKLGGASAQTNVKGMGA